MYKEICKYVLMERNKMKKQEFVEMFEEVIFAVAETARRSSPNLCRSKAPVVL